MGRRTLPLGEVGLKLDDGRPPQWMPIGFILPVTLTSGSLGLRTMQLIPGHREEMGGGGFSVPTIHTRPQGTTSSSPLGASPFVSKTWTTLLCILESFKSQLCLSSRKPSQTASVVCS